MEGKTINVYTGALINGDIENVFLGTFIIDKPKEEEVTKKTEFTGYDYLIKFNTPFENRYSYPISLFNLLSNVCSQVGVELENESIVNGDYQVQGNPFTAGESNKTVIEQICQLCGGFAMISSSNRLKIVNLGKNEISDILDGEVYTSLSKNLKYGKINSVTLNLSNIEGEITNLKNQYNITYGSKNQNICYDIWELGQYGLNGEKASNNSRARLPELIEIPENESIYFNTNNSHYRFVIRTYDKNKEFISSIGAVNNNTSRILENAKYIGVTIYNPSNGGSSEGQNIINKIQNEEIKPYISRTSEKNYNYVKFEAQGEENITISDNYFLTNQEEREKAIDELFETLDGIEFVPYEMQNYGFPYLEIGDRIEVIDPDEKTFYTYIFDLEFKYDGSYNGNYKLSEKTKTQKKYGQSGTTKEKLTRVERLVDKINGEIIDVIEAQGEQNIKISQVTQTVDEINSKISDISDITVSHESLEGYVVFQNINESEPVNVKIRPNGENISYLYPSNTLYPNDNLYMKMRTLRFLNTTTTEVFDYELPCDLLYFDSENYDEFIMEYDSGECYVKKRCKYDNSGNVVLLSSPQIINYDYPTIQLTNGDYQVKILKNYNAPYLAYISVRLMTNNMYTTQFYTKTETDSAIDQKADEIDVSVNQKLSNYSTTNEMNSAINVKANQITSEVRNTYATRDLLGNYTTTTQMNSAITQTAEEINTEVRKKVGEDEVISKINQSAEAVTILANKLGLTANDVLNILAGTAINMKAKNISMYSDNFSVDKNGKMSCSDATITGGNINLKDSGTWDTGNVNATSSQNSNEKASFFSGGTFTQGKYNGTQYGAYYPYQFGVTNATRDTEITDYGVVGSLGSGNVNPTFEVFNNINKQKTTIYPNRIVANGTTYNSKESIKKNIKLYDKKALELIKNSEIYEYNYKSEKDSDKKHIGFVIADEGGGYKTPEEVISAERDGIEQYDMTSILWKAVQEQQKEIEELKKRWGDK